jgi:MSHA pilin protein MshC
VINKYYLSNKGFTLIEIIIVILIIGVLAVTILPQFSSTLNAIRLRTAKEKLIDDLYYVHNFAIANHTTIRFIVDPADNSYRFGIPNGSDLTPITDLSTGDSANIDLTSKYRSVTITTTLVGGGFDYDWWGTPFKMDGSTYTVGSIVLNGSETINIVPETGFIHVP